MPLRDGGKGKGDNPPITFAPRPGAKSPTPGVPGASPHAPDTMSDQTRIKLMELFKAATPIEKRIIRFIFGKMNSPEQVKQFFLGAHIELRGDDAKAYKDLDAIIGAENITDRSLTSSHKSTAPQHAYAGRDLLPQILYGQNIDKDGNSYTWIQMEGSPVTANLIDIALHLRDYVIHKVHRVQVTHLGTSTHSEKHGKALVIDAAKITPEQEEHNSELWLGVFLEYDEDIDEDWHDAVDLDRDEENEDDVELTKLFLERSDSSSSGSTAASESPSVSPSPGSPSPENTDKQPSRRGPG